MIRGVREPRFDGVCVCVCVCVCIYIYIYNDTQCSVKYNKQFIIQTNKCTIYIYILIIFCIP